MRDKHPENSGFTLLEIMAVIVIMSILVSGVVVAFNQPLTKARELEFKEKIIATQIRLRDRARRLGDSGILKISSQKLVMEIGDKKIKVPLGESCRVDQVYTREGREFSESSIPVDLHGISKTFAIQIVPQKSKSYWLLFVGGSGEVLEFEQEKDVRAIIDNSKP